MIENNVAFAMVCYQALRIGEICLSDCDILFAEFRKMMSCQGNALSEDAVSYGGFVVESERKRRRICQFDFHHFRIIRNQQIWQQCNSVPDRARIYAVISLHADLNFKFQHYHRGIRGVPLKRIRV